MIKQGVGIYRYGFCYILHVDDDNDDIEYYYGDIDDDNEDMKEYDHDIKYYDYGAEVNIDEDKDYVEY